MNIIQEIANELKSHLDNKYKNVTRKTFKLQKSRFKPIEKEITDIIMLNLTISDCVNKFNSVHSSQVITKDKDYAFSQLNVLPMFFENRNYIFQEIIAYYLKKQLEKFVINGFSEYETFIRIEDYEYGVQDKDAEEIFTAELFKNYSARIINVFSVLKYNVDVESFRNWIIKQKPYYTGKELYDNGSKIYTQAIIDYLMYELDEYKDDNEIWEVLDDFLEKRENWYNGLKSKIYNYYNLSDSVKESMKKIKEKKHKIVISQIRQLNKHLIDRYDISISLETKKYGQNKEYKLEIK